MKRLVSAAGLLAFVASIGLQAQSNDMQANIPFEFRMGTVVMPAGEYKVTQSSNAGLLTLRHIGGASAAAMYLTLPTARKAKAEQGSLEFTRYDDTYFLANVWSANSNEGRTLPKSTLEKELISRAGQVQTAGIILRRK